MEWKGTGFSPYIKSHQQAGALAPEGSKCGQRWARIEFEAIRIELRRSRMFLRKPDGVEGYGLQPVHQSHQQAGALAPEGSKCGQPEGKSEAANTPTSFRLRPTVAEVFSKLRNMQS